MFILFFIYFPLNFDFVLLYYTDDGSLELGSETSGFIAYLGNVLILLDMSYFGKVNNAAMSLILVVLILRFIGKLRFPQSESIFINNFQRIRHSIVSSVYYSAHLDWVRKIFQNRTSQTAG